MKKQRAPRAQPRRKPISQTGRPSAPALDRWDVQLGVLDYNLATIIRDSRIKDPRAVELPQALQHLNLSRMSAGERADFERLAGRDGQRDPDEEARWQHVLALYHRPLLISEKQLAETVGVLRRERERTWRGSFVEDREACVGLGGQLVRERLSPEELATYEEVERAARAEEALLDLEPMDCRPAAKRFHALHRHYVEHRVTIKVLEKALWARGLHMAQISARHGMAPGKGRRAD